MAESGYGEQLCANMLDLSPKSFKTRVSNSPLPVALIATILEPKLGQVGTKLGPGWDQFGTKLGPSWGQVGTKLGSIWAKMTPSWGQAGPGWAKSDHIRAMLGPCCWGKLTPTWAKVGPFGTNLGPIWRQVEIKLGEVGTKLRQSWVKFG